MERVSLNANWEFVKLPDYKLDNFVMPEVEYERISIPHTWYTDDDQYRGFVLYKKSIKVDKNWKKAFIEFLGADQICYVYANKVLIGKHEGAYATFRFEIPTEILKSECIELEVILDNAPNQIISPLIGDFTIFGGLYRDVNLLVTNENHFDYMYYGIDGIIVKTTMEDNKGIISVENRCVVTDNSAYVVYNILDEKGNLVQKVKGNINEKQEIVIDSPKIWNGVNATYLYKIEASIMINEEVADKTDKMIGFRAFNMTADKGFYLNNEHIKINGVSKHQDIAHKYSAITKEDIEKDFEIVDELGANAVRLSHYQHTQSTYDICDEKGYIVWAEIPLLKMSENKAQIENTREQLKELILQNIHHPSIFFWGIQNEIGMFGDAEYMHVECRNLYNIAKELDDSRLVTAANLYTVKNSSELNNVTDMIGYNIYFGWYYGKMQDYSTFLDKLHTDRANMPLGVSEYGVDASVNLHAEEPKVKDYSEEYQALYHETVYDILNSKEYLWGSFVWNLFDFSSSRRNEGGVKYINQKGLVTYDRQTRKDAFYYYKAIWSKEKFIHICSKRFEKRNNDTIDIKIYTNLDSVKLINGNFEVTQNNNGNGTIVFKNVELVDGENTFKVESVQNENKLSDSVTFIKTTEVEESYSLPNTGTGENVKNWFLDEDSLVREGYYSIEDSAFDLIQSKEAMEILKKHSFETFKAITENSHIPLGLTLKRIISYNKETAEKVDIKALNDEFNQLEKLI